MGDRREQQPAAGPRTNASRPLIDGAVRVRVYGLTDVGRTREHNEDAFVVADLAAAEPATPADVAEFEPGARGLLLMVADGMGGAAAGELASSMAVDTVSAELQARWAEAPAQDPLEFAAALRAAVEGANTAIHAHAVRHPALRGMGTTCTAAAVLGEMLYLAQVGDSRAYLVRDGRAVQLTKDQSLIQRLLDAGELTPEQAETSERRNIILQALGPDPIVKVDVTAQRLCADDLLVLCSDGLSGQVNGEQIARFATDECTDLVRLCERLVDEANATGGPDNITVVAAQFTGNGLARAADGDAPRHAVFALPPSDGDTAPRLLPTPAPVRSPRRAYMAAGAFALLIAIVAVLLKVLA